MATHPLHATVSSSRPHPDMSGFQPQPESGHANARDDEAKNKTKPEGYETLMFNV